MRRAFVLLGGAMLAATSPILAQQFDRVTAALPAQTIWTDGVVLADVDGDGDKDILFANGSTYGSGGQQPQHLFLNDGTGTFSASHGDLNLGNVNAKQVIAEDFDNDGDLDIMYAIEGPYPATTQFPRLLINQGGAQAGTEGIFANESGSRLPLITMASFCVCAGDVDDDGDLDVVFTDGATFFGQATQARLYLNDGNGFFTDVTGAQMPADTYNAQDATLIDYDGDFDIDIAISGKGANGKRGRLYLNDGTGNFTISNAFNGLGTGQTYEIDYGDLDGDDDFDMAVQSITSQNEGWGRNDGPTTTVPEFTFPSPNGGDDNEMALIDYDDDGDLDVLVASLNSSGEKLYRNNGNSTFTNQNALIETINDSSLDVGLGDIDGNGTYDFVTAQGESGNFTNKVYFNTGAPDTTPPEVNGVDAGAPTAGSAPHLQLQDGYSDDGHIAIASVDTAFTSPGALSEGPATHMGGGLFRAAADFDGTEASWLCTWDATDEAGNSTSQVAFYSDGPWSYEGDGTQGVGGMPALLADGPLTVGSTVNLTLRRAAPQALCALFLSGLPTPVPFKGGTLYANPALLTFSLITGGGGDIPIPLVVPPGALPGTVLVWQYAIQDATAIGMVSLSNAVRATIP